MIHSPLMLMAVIAMRHFGVSPGAGPAAALAVVVVVLAMAVDGIYDPAARKVTRRFLAFGSG